MNNDKLNLDLSHVRDTFGPMLTSSARKALDTVSSRALPVIESAIDHASPEQRNRLADALSALAQYLRTPAGDDAAQAPDFIDDPHA